MSDACNEGCEGNVPVYPQATFRPSGLDVAMIYGDSTTGTFATGTIGEDTIGLAGLTLTNQYFAAINRTNTSVVDVGAAGIFGLGFPVNRYVLYPSSDLKSLLSDVFFTVLFGTMSLATPLRKTGPQDAKPAKRP